MSAVTLGPAGTYSHRAARAIADDVTFRDSITGVVGTVAEGDSPRGVVPVENSIEGAVTESLDAFVDREIAVVEEVVVPIQHALLARSPSFDVVASHPQALAQCRSYLDSHHPDVATEAVSSTATAVERATADESVAAIAHPDAAADRLSTVATAVQDRPSNATRFLAIAPPDERVELGGKTSLVVTPGTNHPGLLVELLEPFAQRDINLSRVASRPTGERLGDYLFHFDIEAGLHEARARDAIAEMTELVGDGQVKRLGSYDTRHVSG